MKLPEQNGYYKYWDGATGEKTIVKFSYNRIYIFEDQDNGFDPADEEEQGSYFLEPIEPIIFD